MKDLGESDTWAVLELLVRLLRLHIYTRTVRASCCFAIWQVLLSRQLAPLSSEPFSATPLPQAASCAVRGAVDALLCVLRDFPSCMRSQRPVCAALAFFFPDIVETSLRLASVVALNDVGVSALLGASLGKSSLLSLLLETARRAPADAACQYRVWSVVDGLISLAHSRPPLRQLLLLRGGSLTIAALEKLPPHYSRAFRLLLKASGLRSASLASLPTLFHTFEGLGASLASRPPSSFTRGLREELDDDNVDDEELLSFHAAANALELGIRTLVRAEQPDAHDGSTGGGSGGLLATAVGPAILPLLVRALGVAPGPPPSARLPRSADMLGDHPISRSIDTVKARCLHLLRDLLMAAPYAAATDPASRTLHAQASALLSSASDDDTAGGLLLALLSSLNWCLVRHASVLSGDDSSKPGSARLIAMFVGGSGRHPSVSPLEESIGYCTTLLDAVSRCVAKTARGEARLCEILRSAAGAPVLFRLLLWKQPPAQQQQRADVHILACQLLAGRVLDVRVPPPRELPLWLQASSSDGGCSSDRALQCFHTACGLLTNINANEVFLRATDKEQGAMLGPIQEVASSSLLFSITDEELGFQAFKAICTVRCDKVRMIDFLCTVRRSVSASPPPPPLTWTAT